MPSSSQSTVFDVARQLLQRGDPNLLSQPLQVLIPTLAEEAAREALRDLAEAGLADTLGEALEDDCLDRFVAEHCTVREEEAVCRTLLGWLGGATADRPGDDDPARLAEVPPPPTDQAGLLRWAQRHRIEAVLKRRLPGPGAQGRSPTLAECWLGGDRATTPLVQQDRAEAARRALVHAARTQAAISVREQLWTQTPQPTLLTLVRRLRATLAIPPPLQELAELTFLPARPVGLDADTGTAKAQLRTLAGQVLEVRLHLSGHEHRGLVGDCEACGSGLCLHLQALTARLLDAAFRPEDRLHDPLVQLVAEPSWQRFIRALKGPEDPTLNRVDDRRPRATFCLEPERGRLWLSCIVQQPVRSGGYSKGKQLSLGQLNRAPLNQPEDQAVLQAISARRHPLSTKLIAADLLLLRSLCDHPRVQYGPEALLIRPVEAQVQVTFVEQGNGLLPQVTLDGVPLQAGAPNPQVDHVQRYDARRMELRFAALAPAVRRLLTALGTFRGLLPEESYPALAAALPELRRVAQVEAPEAVAGTEQPPPKRLLLRFAPGPADGLLISLSSRPLPLGALWNPGQGPERIHGLLDGQQVHARRDLDFERNTADTLIAALGLEELERVEPFVYRAPTTDAALGVVSAAAQHNELLDLEWAERTRKLHIQAPVQSNDLQVRVFKKGQWLEATGGSLRPGAQVALTRLLQAVRRGERFVPISGDSYAEIADELRNRLQLAQLCAIDLKGTLRFSTVTAHTLLQQLPTECQAGDEETRAWLASAQPQTNYEPPPLDGPLASLLRDYQHTGYAFLAQTSTWAPGACLADEMGLGKTLQTIALLTTRAAQGPAIVLAPTSVVDNWLQELQRFAPQLRPVLYRGPQRQRAREKLGPADVLLMSYNVLLRDLKNIQPIHFTTQVLDEAQWIKNARSARAKAAAAVSADFRVALSGTPVENRLGDLWSLFSVIAPGLLGSWRRFRALFAVPIERYENKERSAHLRSLVAPLILRRTKHQVARELPPRTEVVYRVELSAPERELYQAAVEQAKHLLNKRNRSEAVYSSHVLAELTRLRQLACHPRLVLQQSEVESSKLAALLQLLQDLLPRKHRVLVFSQFVQHLQLVAESLARAQIPFLYLDGATPAAARKNLVQKFQELAAPVFLISLKAGGTGLNLTAADYVVLLDPWWNPASEDQASDRAHRIGQQRPVTVIKLVSADTIEERVLALHGHKRALADDLLKNRAAPAAVDLAAYEALLGLKLT